jgi:hypothetical protein
MLTVAFTDVYDDFSAETNAVDLSPCAPLAASNEGHTLDVKHGRWMRQFLFKVAFIHEGAACGRRNWERLAMDCNSSAEHAHTRAAAYRACPGTKHTLHCLMSHKNMISYVERLQGSRYAFGAAVLTLTSQFPQESGIGMGHE